MKMLNSCGIQMKCTKINFLRVNTTSIYLKQTNKKNLFSLLISMLKNNIGKPTLTNSLFLDSKCILPATLAVEVKNH